jgi:hypothetical protein
MFRRRCTRVARTPPSRRGATIPHMRWLLPLLRERRFKSLSSSLDDAASRLSSVDKAGVELLRSRLMAFRETLVASASLPNRVEGKVQIERAFRTAETILLTIGSLSNDGQRNLKRKEVVQLVQLLDANTATERSIQSACKERTSGPQSKRPKSLQKVASQYAAEAADEKRAAHRLRLIAWAFMLVAVMIAITGLALASLGNIDSGWPTANFALVAIFVAGIGGTALVMSERRRRAELELNRLRQHLHTLEPYVQPMDPETGSLIRAILAARIFARPSNPDESLWEPMWPSADQLLAARQDQSLRHQ